MKVTIALIAFYIAAQLYKEGGWAFALLLAVVAIWEGLIQEKYQAAQRHRDELKESAKRFEALLDDQEAQEKSGEPKRSPETDTDRNSDL